MTTENQLFDAANGMLDKIYITCLAQHLDYTTKIQYNMMEGDVAVIFYIKGRRSMPRLVHKAIKDAGFHLAEGSAEYLPAKDTFKIAFTMKNWKGVGLNNMPPINLDAFNAVRER